MKLNASLLLISSFHILIAFGTWNELSEDNLDYIFDNTEEKNDYFEQVPDGNIFGDNKVGRYTEPAKQNLEENPSSETNKIKSSKRVFYQSSKNITPCSCEMEYKLLNLGHNYFPRYIHTMICKETSCGNLYRCKASKHYEVQVLKMKTPTARTDGFSGSLRHNWTPEVKDVIVGCECILRN